MYGLRTVQEVEAALGQKYDGRTKIVKGSGGNDFTYISWDDAVRELDAVFGVFGWDMEPVDFEGHPGEGIYLATVKLTGRAYDEESGSVVEFTRPGFGRGVARASKADAERTGSPVSSDLSIHDTAAATAGSDAATRATKMFGDRFGLFFYDKEQNGSTQAGANNFQRATGTSPFAKKTQQGGNGGDFKYKNPDAPASAGQLGVLRRLNVSEDEMAGLTMAQAGQMIDALNGAKASGF